MVAGNAFVLSQGVQFRVELEIGFSQGVMGYSDMAQADRMPDTRAKGFGKRFLGGKTLRQEHGRLHAFYILRPLLVCQQASGETLSVFFQQARNTRGFNQIGSDSINHLHASSIRFFISRTACSKPTNSARATIACPMLSSDTPGIAAIAWTFW